MNVQILCCSTMKGKGQAFLACELMPEGFCQALRPPLNILTFIYILEKYMCMEYLSNVIRIENS